MAYKTFPEMISSLRAAYVSGMDCTITLKPDSAALLADVLEEHNDRLRLSRMGKILDALGL